jgi:hypothetical protein
MKWHNKTEIIISAYNASNGTKYLSKPSPYCKVFAELGIYIKISLLKYHRPLIRPEALYYNLHHETLFLWIITEQRQSPPCPHRDQPT